MKYIQLNFLIDVCKQVAYSLFKKYQNERCLCDYLDILIPPM